MRTIKSLRFKRLTIFIVYIILVLTFTFIVRETMIWRYSGKHEAALIPFRQLIGFFKKPNHMLWFWQIILNIILFIPFGFLFPIIQPKQSKATIAYGFMFSLGIEIMQYITGRGLADIDDLINNTLGAVIGCFIYRAGKMAYDRRKT